MPQQPFVLFTYSRSGGRDDDRWAPTGIPSLFFEDFETAKRSVIDLKNEVLQDDEHDWPATDIEKIEILPLDKTSTIALLNRGVGAIVRQREVVLTIT